MTHPMQAAADAVIALRLSDKPHGPDEYARAAITAFLDAVEKDDAACASIAEDVDAEMARQTENAIALGRGPNYPACGRVALAALKRIAEESP